MTGPKVWIIADYSGNLHEVPYNTKAYFLNRNIMVKDKTKQFKFIKESTGGYTDDKGHFVPGEAFEFIKANKGVDPKYVAPKDMVNELTISQAENERLRKEIEALRNPTVPEAVKQVKAAQSAEEAAQIAAQFDEKQVEKAATEKIKELSKADEKQKK